MAFVVPYLGSWPKWSPLFFRSVELNPAVTVLLVCEQEPWFAVPPNVALIRTTKQQLLSRLNRGTGLHLADISGHKLCDFRPFFGRCFADLLEPYEFWGFCDIDVMFGDLSRLLTSDFLDEIDVFTAHDSQIAGHFTILRNSDHIHRAAFEIADWEAKCSQPENVLLEELHFPAALRSVESIRWAKPDGLDVELTKAFCAFGITFDFQGGIAHTTSRQPGMAEWSEGRVAFVDAGGRRSEVLYVHFMGLKRWWHWLFLDSEVERVDSCRFSRVGYGGPDTVEGLASLRWRFIYSAQRALLTFKSRMGGWARSALPRRTFLGLRRVLFGRGRH